MPVSLTMYEWLPASGPKWIGRECLCLFSDGHKAVATWNGMYWVGQHGMRIMEELYHVVYFMLYELPPEIAKI